MNFSVLMSIYYKENPQYLESCFDSIARQTVSANEVVLVIDGPIGQALTDVIARWKKFVPIKTVPLNVNVGLGKALNVGLNACCYDVVARMDTDDVCHPRRFELMLDFMRSNPDVDVLSCAIAEFDISPDKSHAIRTLPLTHEAICKYAKRRSPFNHPAVFFKRSSVLAVGGYQDIFLYEDYALWVKMIMSNARVANLPDVLLYARVGNGMEVRRGGADYAISEAKAQYLFYSMGFFSFFVLFSNLCIRIPVRLLPSSIRKLLYRNFLR